MRWTMCETQPNVAGMTKCDINDLQILHDHGVGIYGIRQQIENRFLLQYCIS